MDIGNVLNLQTQAAHGVIRPQAKPVQPGSAAMKKSWTSGSDSSTTTTTSYRRSLSTSSTPPLESTSCTRCRRSINGLGGNVVSYGSHLHYCGACTLLLESRG